MLTPVQLEELRLLQELHRRDAQKHLIDFIEYTTPAYDAQWFHRLVCSYVEKVILGDIKKLMIFLPPQHGKTQISSRHAPAWALGRNPKEKIIVASYNVTKAGEFCVESKRIIKSPEYKEVFPNVEVDGSDQTIYFEVNQTGFYKAAGVESGITGNTATLGIIDDPFKGRKDANSPNIRDAAWQWYLDDFSTRLNNESRELMLFTRWHEDDIAGRILDPKNPHYNPDVAKKWTVIAIPALKEATKPLDCAIDIEDPREIDEALWPEKHAAEKYFIRRETSPRSFYSLDQQRPTAEGGNKIKAEWLEVISEAELPFNPDHKVVNFWIDGAFTDKTENDETAVLAEIFHEGILYIMNCSAFRKELYEFLEYFPQYAKINRRSTRSKVHIELKASGHDMKSMISKPMFGGFNAIQIPNRTVGLGKLNRVENSEPFLQAGKVKIVKGTWNARFIEQLCAFPNGSHDDMVDVVCYAIHEYLVNDNKSRGSVSYTD